MELKEAQAQIDKYFGESDGDMIEKIGMVEFLHHHTRTFRQSVFKQSDL